MLMTVNGIEALRAEAFGLAADHVGAGGNWHVAFEYDHIEETDGTGAHHKVAVATSVNDLAATLAAAGQSLRDAGFGVIESLDYPMIPYLTATRDDLLVSIHGFENSGRILVEAVRPLR